MATKMGFNVGETKNFESNDNPADAILRFWGTKSGNDVNRLVTILEEMGRDDLVDILKNAQSKIYVI